jgi:ketosteroid isomerase-like protein
MSQENVDKNNAFMEAYNRRDFDEAIKDFDPQVEFILPPQQASDSCVGARNIVRFWDGLEETFENLQLHPQEVVDAGDRVATRLRHSGRGKASGVEIDAELYHQVITFRDGVMVRMEYFDNWEAALAAAHAPTEAGAAGERTETASERTGPRAG